MLGFWHPRRLQSPIIIMIMIIIMTIIIITIIIIIIVRSTWTLRVRELCILLFLTSSDSSRAPCG